MNDLSGLIVPLCSLSIVCGGLLVIGVFLAIRFLGLQLPGILGSFNDLAADEKSDSLAFRAQASRRRRPDLRQKAQSLDFDAAVNRQRDYDSPIPPRPADTDSTFGAQGSNRSRRSDSLRRRRKSEHDEDEIFGGMLDEDGDGSVDF
jgi:hypothetical protein